MSDDGWTWELSSKADGDLDSLSPAEQDRILDKLDEIVSSPWRDPPEYGEPLQNSPHKKYASASFDCRWRSERTNDGSSSHESNAGVARTRLTTTDVSAVRRSGKSSGANEWRRTHQESTA